MLRKHSEVLRGLLALADLALVSAAWLGAIWLRFESGWLPDPTHAYDVAQYPWLLLGILPIWHILLRWRGLYDGHRVHSLASETRRLFEVCVLGTVFLATLTFFGQLAWVSRLTVTVFSGLALAGLVSSRLALRALLRGLRRRGRFVQSVLIVGTGTLAREIHARLARHPELGFRVRGFLGPSPAGLGGDSAPWLGTYENLHNVVLSEDIEQVVLALDRSDPANPLKLLRELHDTTAAVRFVPDLLGIDTVQGGIEDFDGLPMIRLIESPLVGWNAVLKRALDVVGAGAALVVGAPIFAALAVAVKLSSPGPVFYRQERMGLDGRLFSMWKFRTMVQDAERETGAVWAVANDARRTPLGAFLRRTNLDEIPQFWNVLVGEMSLVGPRPERPEFIREFRAGLPGYMLRHKVKGGLTGWAQVNGCRGNTSIEKRLEYDMAYLRRWSLGFDVRILLLTVVRSFNDPNAY
ncbi:MAG TPA: undecaprenyl-phosphate glucose phosphotransferase [Myxococcota bacterium]|nr:undecaprenyl-phosphate glucose phosphotransferase [Myxococcota bacterium]